MKKLSQRERIVKVLQSLRDGTHRIPPEFLKESDEGLAISTRYFKQVMLISECNGRISEARAEGFLIDTLPGKDEYGFVYHLLRGEPMKAAKPAPLIKHPKTGELLTHEQFALL